MGSFFEVNGGGGAYPPRPSPASNGAAARCLRDMAHLPEEAVQAAEGRTVAEVVQVCLRLHCYLSSQTVSFELANAL